MSEAATGAIGVFDPAAVIRTLYEHGVRYILIGGVAARIHGSPTLTEDVDLTPERTADNLGRLPAALDDLGARMAVVDVPGGLAIPLDEHTFSSPVMKFTTTAGEIDIVLAPTGVGGYEQLLPRAVDFEVFGIRLRVAALDDIVASRRPADDPRTWHNSGSCTSSPTNWPDAASSSAATSTARDQLAGSTTCCQPRGFASLRDRPSASTATATGPRPHR